MMAKIPLSSWIFAAQATAIFTPFSRPEQQQVAEKGLSDLQRHYYQDDGKRYKLGWAPAVPRYFSR